MQYIQSQRSVLMLHVFIIYKYGKQIFTKDTGLHLCQINGPKKILYALKINF